MLWITRAKLLAVSVSVASLLAGAGNPGAGRPHLAPSTSVDPALPAPPGPFAYPSPAPGGGFYVTCNLAAPSAACRELVATYGPATSGSAAAGFGIATFLVNDPAYYPLLTKQTWVPYTK